MQLAVIEFARNAAGLKDANTTEINPKTKHPVIDTMEEQKRLIEEKHYGGSMRLGGYSCDILPGTISARAYGVKSIKERHRHRYEFNNKFKKVLEEKGLVIGGVNKERNLVEIIELKNHPFFVGVQFHPEFSSRPMLPQPLFREFIKAAIKQKPRGQH
jgi:CTP synthase